MNAEALVTRVDAVQPLRKSTVLHARASHQLYREAALLPHPPEHYASKIKQRAAKLENDHEPPYEQEWENYGAEYRTMAVRGLHRISYRSGQQALSSSYGGYLPYFAASHPTSSVLSISGCLGYALGGGKEQRRWLKHLRRRESSWNDHAYILAAPGAWLGW
ncbi:hypothetical protein OBBRIDRAFT_807143 [Obba rivulosa]|uniref:Uncharacterized protein n=1 Tax=Obba rivulosa TaxID=1052685 RepID=A0A8E2DGG2_9APHY|nr:hypothetical protein OBBRIDRAFT_807143 [Obba rivulosa]